MGQSKLAYKDESTGQGDSAVNGDVLKVSFVGKVFPSGAQFAKNDDFVFELGEGKTLPGFDTALLGTQAGTKRLIRVPPSMAYGKQGMPVRFGLLLPVVGTKAFVVAAATQGTSYCHVMIPLFLRSTHVISAPMLWQFLLPTRTPAGSPASRPMPIWSLKLRSRRLPGTRFRAKSPSLERVACWV
jgi:hypothetical protein